ncbi:dipeptidase [Flavihumibacter rivuli]|uniref:dipeptidase n=1 Tax=Flavihumibacter rivuli TaxID=2838156 RepID=UPI001BDF1894|nr:dipeptidase [Flavihumibacter rivuli]ULQ55551.1 dipeptidase [Flavihumibacter rivuli]
MRLSLGLIALMFSFSPVATHAQRSFHDKLVVVDTHNDVISTASMNGMSFDTDLYGKTHSDLNRFRKGGVDIQIFSIFCDETFGKGTAFNRAVREMDSLDAIVARNPDRIMAVNSYADLKKAIKAGKIGAMKGVEGGHMIEDRLDLLDSLYQRGARYLTLTWNNSTSWASSAWDETYLDQGKPTPISQKGLNEQGRQIVRRMNELGMMVDLSHVGVRTFYDALAVSSKPVIVSHSCCHKICPVPRNLTDDQIKAIAKNGGVIHVNFYSGFVDSTYNKKKEGIITKYKAEKDSLLALQWSGHNADEWIFRKYAPEVQALRPGLDQLLDHIDHIVAIAGIDHVGIGSDFDGIESAPQGLEGVEDMPRVTEALLARGYSKKEVAKIMGENFLRLYKAVSPN